MIRFIIRTIFIAVIITGIAAPQSFARDQILDIKEVKTESGITAWLVEDHSIPVIAMQFAFKGAGSIQESADKQGLVRLLSNTMDEGAGELASEEFQKTLRDLSISLAFSSSRDAFSGGVKTLSANKDKAFELLTLALNEPRFDEEPVSRMIAANQARIRSSLSDPEWMAARLMNDKAYGNHPYALNSGGTLSTLPKLTPDDLRNFAKTHLTRDRLHIAVAGDITEEELKGVLDRIFAPLPEKAPEIKTEAVILQNKGQVFLYKQEIPQTVIEIIQPGIERDDPDYFKAQVMNFILGSSGFGSRLTEEIREKRGLTYGIYSYLSNGDYFDGFAVSTSTANDNTKEMLSLITAEWEKMRSYPVSQEELDNAKSYLIGSLPLSLTSTDAFAGLMLSLQLDNLGMDYLDKRETAIQAASLDDIFAVSQRLLAPENFVTVLVGSPAGIDQATTIETLPNVE
jgi:zinc protease